MNDEPSRERSTTDHALAAAAERLADLCQRTGLRVAVAESCTGGLLGHAITMVPGASTYFVGGVIAYADEVKEALLGVPASLVEAHGAVSAQVARAMAEGARSRLGADVAVAVTGIAGPGGGTAAKPVGLTYVAVAGPGGAEVRRHQWTGDRDANKRASVLAALELLLEVARRVGEPAGS
jgi:PncC family amidohydrolase